MPLSEHLALHGMYLSALDAVARAESVIDALTAKLSAVAQECGAHP